MAKCKVCARFAEAGKKKNDWVTGKHFINWYSSTFDKHENSATHVACKKLPALRRDMEVAMETAWSKAEFQTKGLMINCLGAMQHELPLNKVQFLHELADIHINRTIQSVTAEFGRAPSRPNQLPPKHRSLYSTYKILKCINKAQVMTDSDRFSKAQSICIHVDESTDVSNTKLLLIYVTIVSHNPRGTRNGEVFGALLELKDGCDAETITLCIYDWMASVGIPSDRVAMFTSDGAAVMLGRNNGVAQRLLRDFFMPHLLSYHCVCHRENLAMKEAYKAENFEKLQDCVDFVNLERILRDVISFLSPVKNLAGLKKVTEVLEENLYVPKRIFEIRWMSRFEVIDNFVESMPSILTYFELKSNEENADPQVRPLHRRLSHARNLILPHHLHDLMKPFHRLMERTQKATLLPFEAMEMIEATLTQVRAECLDRDDDDYIKGPKFNALVTKYDNGKITPGNGSTVSAESEFLGQCDRRIRGSSS